jgi:hypothetical protein
MEKQFAQYAITSTTNRLASPDRISPQQLDLKLSLKSGGVQNVVRTRICSNHALA